MFEVGNGGLRLSEDGKTGFSINDSFGHCKYAQNVSLEIFSDKTMNQLQNGFASREDMWQNDSTKKYISKNVQSQLVAPNVGQNSFR